MNPFRTGKLVLYQVIFTRGWHDFELIPFCVLGIIGVCFMSAIDHKYLWDSWLNYTLNIGYLRWTFHKSKPSHCKVTERFSYKRISNCGSCHCGIHLSLDQLSKHFHASSSLGACSKPVSRMQGNK